MLQISPAKINFKTWCMNHLIKNLDISHGHCNGTRYIMKELAPRLINTIKHYGDPHSEILIPCIPIVSKDRDFPIPFKRLWFRILLAYYLKLNRAQGQSLDRACIYLPKNVFSHGRCLLVIQGGLIPMVCIFMQTRVNLTVLKNIWWKARHIHAILSIQNYFPGSNN